MAERKEGPLTRQELTALWKSVTDEEYHRPFFEQPDSGVEAIEQAHEQFARTSESIDRTTQSMFIFPWSGQTDEPASGAQLARVTLSIERTALPPQPLILQAGLIVLHVVDDFGPDGAVEVVTARRYLLEDDLVFGVGELGPKPVDAVSERPGHSYNLPLPGTLKRIEQLGFELINTGATHLPVAGTNRLLLDPEPDILTIFNVGQYIELTGGPNVGQIRRVVAWTEDGSGVNVDLAATSIASVSGVAGTFIQGEDITQPGGITHTFVALSNGKLVSEARGAAELLTATVVTGQVSGATATVDVIEQVAFLTASPTAGDTGWQVLDWGTRLGLVVTNPESPSGGRSPMLDELGGERDIPRSPGEGDDLYRDRVGKLADVISPNALRRVANKVLAPLGLSVCLREIGRPVFPGFFYDGGSSSDVPQNPERNFAYDMDFAVRPEDRFKLVMSRLNMRAYFLIGVPPLTLGEFGFAYDEGGDNFYDANDLLNFYDGAPVQNAAVYQSVYNAIDRAKAGGVGFDLYIERLGCY
jgi:hypothetical protein